MFCPLREAWLDLLSVVPGQLWERSHGQMNGEHGGVPGSCESGSIGRSSILSTNCARWLELGKYTSGKITAGEVP